MDQKSLFLENRMLRSIIFLFLFLKEHLAWESPNKTFNIGAPSACGLDPWHSVSTRTGSGIYQDRSLSIKKSLHFVHFQFFY